MLKATHQNHDITCCCSSKQYIFSPSAFFSFHHSHTHLNTHTHTSFTTTSCFNVLYFQRNSESSSLINHPNVFYNGSFVHINYLSRHLRGKHTYITLHGLHGNIVKWLRQQLDIKKSVKMCALHQMLFLPVSQAGVFLFFYLVLRGPAGWNICGGVTISCLSTTISPRSSSKKINI